MCIVLARRPLHHRRRATVLGGHCDCWSAPLRISRRKGLLVVSKRWLKDLLMYARQILYHARDFGRRLEEVLSDTGQPPAGTFAVSSLHGSPIRSAWGFLFFLCIGYRSQSRGNRRPWHLPLVLSGPSGSPGVSLASLVPATWLQLLVATYLGYNTTTVHFCHRTEILFRNQFGF